MKTIMRRCLPAFLTLPAVLALGGATLADASRYAVTPKTAASPEGEPRFDFPVTGLIVGPEHAAEGAWSFDLRFAGVSFDGRFVPAASARLSALDNRVDYEFDSGRVSYLNSPKGLEQRITVSQPEIRIKDGAATVIDVDLSVDGTLKPVIDGYFVNLVSPTGEVVMRYGPVDAEAADEKRLDAQLVLAKDDEGVVTGLRITVNAIDPAFPIEVRASVTSGSAGKAQIPQTPSTEMVGTPVTLGFGITETVDKIMERERAAPFAFSGVPRETHHEFENEEELKDDPDAPPPMSHWPPIPETLATSAAAPEPPNLPQTVGTSFKGVGLSEAGFIPPDSMGDVGPGQILMHVNGRIKVFDKAGAVGALNATDATFWAAVSSGQQISDPQVRYDRLSGRWFVLAITIGSTNNQIVLAVSSGPTITGVGSFTFYQFSIGTAAPADASCFCDYPGMGVDANAIYTGCNMFTCSFHTSAFVIRKSSVLSGGPIVVTGFSNIANSGLAGPYAPRGVDNDDPNATQGYIIGSDPAFLNRLNIRRVSNPGGSPTLSATITLPISNTNMLNQPALNSTTDVSSSDSRFYAASIRKNKLTGVISMWTAHAVETDATCAPLGAGTARRIGAKWYEVGNLTTTPTILQFGTLCSTTAGNGTPNSQRGFLYPTVIGTGQGHVALSASYASATEFVGVAAAGRLRTDPAGGTRAPETIVLAGLASYTQLDPNRNRWGDYSFTDVDPNDDMTVWTFQEYADSPANNWSVRAVQLKAPPPPNTAVASNLVCNGVTAAPVTFTAPDSCAAPTCTNGLCTSGGACPEFFDPGPDTGGPGYARHLTATATGGITVNSASIVLPATPATQRVLSVALSLNTTASTTGTKSVSIINPDLQARVYTINVIGNRAPVSNAGGPYIVCSGDSANLNGTASSEPDAACGDSIASYEWDLNGDAVIDFTGPTPTVTPAQLTALGLGVGPHTITLKVTDTHALTNTANGTLTIVANGGACTDGNACTQTDTCSAGICVGSNPVTCSASDQCHVAGVCDTGTGVCSNPNAPNGSACADGNACTQTDSCQGGVCVGSNPVNCADSDPCTTDSCDPGTGSCLHPAAPNGTGCNDGNACTQTDTCQSGICTGANPVVCTPLNQCHLAGVCNTGTGVCTNPNAPDGNACSDGNACTQTDTCQTGTCTGSNPVVCTALDQCHVVGTCNTGTGVCSNPNAPNGNACNDGNACTQTDTCQTGTCTGSNPVICSPSDQCHLAGVCDTGTGTCSNPEAPDGTACNDQDPATCGDVCTSLACAGHAVAAPTDINNSLLLDKAPSDTTLTWSDAPGPYGVYRGVNGPSPTPWAYNQTCLVPAVMVQSAVDSVAPGPGVLFYYLVSRYNECRESALGTDSSATPIPNTQPCPAP